MINFTWNQIFWFSLVLKLIISAGIPLSADESYYWVWSKHLQLSYFDHPVGVALLFWLGSPFENFLSAVRWPGVLFGHVTLLLWAAVLKPMFSPSQMKLFTLLVLLSPLTGPGSLIVTPDLPMIFFAALSLFILKKGLDLSPTSSRRMTIFCFCAGIALGLSFTSKYTAVLFIPALCAMLFQSPLSMGQRVGLTLAAACGFVFFASPPFVWNAYNNWISFGFQLEHGLGGKSWQIKNTLHYIGAQIALIFPVILFFAFKAKGPLWLKISAWFPIGFFLFTTTKGYVEANWPIGAYLPLIALATMADNNRRWLKGTMVTWAVAFALALSLLVHFWLPMPINKIKLKELYRYSEISEQLKNTKPLYARTYQMASKLSFNLKRPIYKLRGLNRFDNFDLWAGSLPPSDFFFLVADPQDVLPLEIQDRFKIVNRSALAEGYELWRLETL